MWLGTMSTSTPSPAPCAAFADLGQALGPAARRVDPVVVDHVVAVVAARLRLQQRREVDPVDAEVVQVVGELGRRVQVERVAICSR